MTTPVTVPLSMRDVLARPGAPEHALEYATAYLEARAITPEVAQARGYYTPGTDELKTASKQMRIPEEQASAATAFATPRYTLNDVGELEVTPGLQFRRIPDAEAPAWGTDKKFRGATGFASVGDVHPYMVDVVLDQSVPLIITEGIAKADSIVSNAAPGSVAVLSWPGVDIPVSMRGELVAPRPGDILELHPTIFQDRKVIIVFDADAYTKTEVSKATDRIAALAAAAGADVHIGRVERVNGDPKSGIDDVIAAAAPEERADLITSIVEGAETWSGWRLARMKDQLLTAKKPPKAVGESLWMLERSMTAWALAELVLGEGATARGEQLLNAHGRHICTASWDEAGLPGVKRINKKDEAELPQAINVARGSVSSVSIARTLSLTTGGIDEKRIKAALVTLDLRDPDVLDLIARELRGDVDPDPETPSEFAELIEAAEREGGPLGARALVSGDPVVVSDRGDGEIVVYRPGRGIFKITQAGEYAGQEVLIAPHAVWESSRSGMARLDREGSVITTRDHFTRVESFITIECGGKTATTDVPVPRRSAEDVGFQATIAARLGLDGARSGEARGRGDREALVSAFQALSTGAPVTTHTEAFGIVQRGKGKISGEGLGFVTAHGIIRADGTGFDDDLIASPEVPGAVFRETANIVKPMLGKQQESWQLDDGLSARYFQEIYRCYPGAPGAGALLVAAHVAAPMVSSSEIKRPFVLGVGRPERGKSTAVGGATKLVYGSPADTAVPALEPTRAGVMTEFRQMGGLVTVFDDIQQPNSQNHFDGKPVSIAGELAGVTYDRRTAGRGSGGGLRDDARVDAWAFGTSEQSLTGGRASRTISISFEGHEIDGDAIKALRADGTAPHYWGWLAKALSSFETLEDLRNKIVELAEEHRKLGLDVERHRVRESIEAIYVSFRIMGMNNPADPASKPVGATAEQWAELWEQTEMLILSEGMARGAGQELGQRIIDRLAERLTQGGGGYIDASYVRPKLKASCVNTPEWLQSLTSIGWTINDRLIEGVWQPAAEPSRRADSIGTLAPDGRSVLISPAALSEAMKTIGTGINTLEDLYPALHDYVVLGTKAGFAAPAWVAGKRTRGALIDLSRLGIDPLFNPTTDLEATAYAEFETKPLFAARVGKES